MSIPSFPTKSPSTSMALQGETSVYMPHQYYALSYPCSRVLTVQIKLSNSCHRLHPSRLQTGVNFEGERPELKGDGVTVSSKILCFVPKFSNLCVVLHCHFEARILRNPSWALLASRCRCQSLLSLLLVLYLQESHLNSPRKQRWWPCH